MNVKDVEVIEVNKSEIDMLDFIFVQQHKLAMSYIEIEALNNPWVSRKIPVLIDSPHGQVRLKDFMWRVTEELAEAQEACTYPFKESVHMIEELADAFHFLVELAILSDIRSQDIFLFCTHPSKEMIKDSLDYIFFNVEKKSQSGGSVAWCFWAIVKNLGLAANCLKQKPWKQTHQLTDRNLYKEYILKTFLEFFSMCKTFDMTSEDLFNIYFKKNKVNQFRIRSKY